MSKTKFKDPRKTPILSVIVDPPQHHSYGAIACLKIGFRYWCNEMNRLQYYGDNDYRVTKFALGNFYLKHVVSGDRPERENDDEYCPWIRYENLYCLELEEQAKAMAKTLLYFNSRLKPMQWQQPRPCIAQYIEEVARLLKIKEAVINDGATKIPLAEALKFISDTSWKLRQRCLVLERNLSSEQYAQKWCDRNGYSELQSVDGFWWAIPPNQVMPISIESSLKL